MVDRSVLPLVLQRYDVNSQATNSNERGVSPIAEPAKPASLCLEGPAASLEAGPVDGGDHSVALTPGATVEDRGVLSPRSSEDVSQKSKPKCELNGPNPSVRGGFADNTNPDRPERGGTPVELLSRSPNAAALARLYGPRPDL